VQFKDEFDAANPNAHAAASTKTSVATHRCSFLDRAPFASTITASQMPPLLSFPFETRAFQGCATRFIVSIPNPIPSPISSPTPSPTPSPSGQSRVPERALTSCDIPAIDPAAAHWKFGRFICAQSNAAPAMSCFLRLSVTH
jgi:hypothetical protein